MMEAIERYEHKGFTIEIHYDTDVEAPDEDNDDRPVYLVGFCRNFDVSSKKLGVSNRSDVEQYIPWIGPVPEEPGDEPRAYDYPSNDAFIVAEELWDAANARFEEYEEWQDNYVKGYKVFAVDVYDHGGIALALAGSVDAARMPDRQWDVSTGRAFVIVHMDGDWGTSADDTGYSHTRDEVTTTVTWEQVAEAVVTEWNQYLSGTVYGYRVLDSDGEEHDSCWGFYGDIEYVKSEAERAADGLASETRKVTFVVCNQGPVFGVKWWDTTELDVPLIVGDSELVDFYMGVTPSPAIVHVFTLPHD